MRKNKLSLALIACGFAVFATACDGGGEDASSQCVDDREYFQKEVWSKFMQQQCTSCHTNGGIADTTDFVLQTSAQTGFLDANFTVVRDVASLERDGVSQILLKPTTQIAHEGGLIFEEGSAEYEALAEMVNRFQNPVTCGEETRTDEQFAGVTVLDPNETFRKATVNLAGRLPTAAEDFRIATGGEDALDAELDNLLHEELFYQRLEEVFNDMFLTDRYLGRTNALDLLDPDYYPDARWFVDDEDNPRDLSAVNQEFLENARMYTNDSFARENLKLARWLVENDRPFTEIITADYMVMNPYTAAAYGVEGIQFENPLDPNEWKAGQIPGHPHAGVLTSPMWLNRFPTTPTNRNRHRSRMVYWFFLATDVMKLAERPLDPTNITLINAPVNDAACNVCHKVIDPVAGSLQNWDDEGNFNPPEEGWYPEMFQPGFADKDLPYDGTQSAGAAKWLADQIVQDRRFATSMVHHMYRGLTGQEPLTFPTEPDSPTYQADVLQYEVQDKIFDEIAQKFIDSGFNLRVVFKELIKSNYFRADNYAGENQEHVGELSQLGMARMLTPEMLDRKIEAVLGRAWADNNGDHYLLDESEYRLLYGGIDSDDVTTRMTDPNGIMAGIQWRFANEMSCSVTARDFTSPAEKRRLFPYVEIDTAPVDESGFPDPEAEVKIRKNIAHMHYHLLGECLETNDPEVTRTFNLFLETLQEGRLKMANEELDSRLLCGASTDVNGVELPDEERITNDESYTIRAWMAVTTYLLSDYRFLYE